MDAYLAQGKTLCLFVGRTPKEKLPLETGEAKPNEIWVSGDSTNNGPAINPQRIHLHMDFNQQALIEKLRRKFHLIVVDLSVIKFLDNDFANRFSVMLRTAESRMIFESASGCLGINPARSAKEPIFDPLSYTVTYPFYLNQGKDTKPFVEFGKQKLKSHLQGSFSSVELIDDRPYPYLNNYSRPNQNPSFFIVSGHRSLITTEIRVKCELPRGHILTIRGKSAGLNWGKGIPLTKVDNQTYVYRYLGRTDPLIECKIMLDDQTWEEGSNHFVEQGKQVEIIPQLSLPKPSTLITVYGGPNDDLYIRGDGPGLNWEKGQKMKYANSKWTFESDQRCEPFEFKVLKQDKEWEQGDNSFAIFNTELAYTPKFL